MHLMSLRENGGRGIGSHPPDSLPVEVLALLEAPCSSWPRGKPPETPVHIVGLLHGLNCPLNIALVLRPHFYIGLIPVSAKTHLFHGVGRHLLSDVLLGHRIDLGNGHVARDGEVMSLGPLEPSWPSSWRPC